MVQDGKKKNNDMIIIIIIILLCVCICCCYFLSSLLGIGGYFLYKDNKSTTNNITQIEKSLKDINNTNTAAVSNNSDTAASTFINDNKGVVFNNKFKNDTFTYEIISGDNCYLKINNKYFQITINTNKIEYKLQDEKPVSNTKLTKDNVIIGLDGRFLKNKELNNSNFTETDLEYVYVPDIHHQWTREDDETTFDKSCAFSTSHTHNCSYYVNTYDKIKNVKYYQKTLYNEDTNIYNSIKDKSLLKRCL